MVRKAHLLLLGGIGRHQLAPRAAVRLTLVAPLVDVQLPSRVTHDKAAHVGAKTLHAGRCRGRGNLALFGIEKELCLLVWAIEEKNAAIVRSDNHTLVGKPRLGG